MNLIGLLVVLIIVGVLLWLVNQVIPMHDKIKLIINVLVILVVCLWLLQQLELLGPIGNIQLR